MEDAPSPLPFAVLPLSAEFVDIEKGNTYCIRLFIHNVSSRSLVLKVSKPTISQFQVQLGQKSTLPPGLETTLEIYFTASEEKEYHDTVTLLAEGGGSLDIPLAAFLPMPLLEFDPLLNFGTLKLGETHETTITIRNSGSAPGILDLSFTQPPVEEAPPVEEESRPEPSSASDEEDGIDLGSDASVQHQREALREKLERTRTAKKLEARRLPQEVSRPESGTIQQLFITPQNIQLAAGESVGVSVKFTAKAVGVFRSIVSLTLMPSGDRIPQGLGEANSLFPHRTTGMIDFNVSVVGSMLFVSTRKAPDTPVSHLDLGSVVFGERRTNVLILSNPTPVPANFTFSVVRKDIEGGREFGSRLSVLDAHTPSNGADISKVSSGLRPWEKPLITVSPSRGVVPPRSSIDLEVTFAPLTDPEEAKNFIRAMQHTPMEQWPRILAHLIDIQLGTIQQTLVSNLEVPTTSLREIIDRESHSTQFSQLLSSTAQMQTAKLAKSKICSPSAPSPLPPIPAGSSRDGKSRIGTGPPYALDLHERAKQILLKATENRKLGIISGDELDSGILNDISPEVWSVNQLGHEFLLFKPGADSIDCLYDVVCYIDKDNLNEKKIAFSTEMIACRSFLGISQTSLCFGACVDGEPRRIDFVVKSLSRTTPLKIDISVPAPFSFRDDKLVASGHKKARVILAPLESRTLPIYYVPQSLGVHRGVMELSIMGTNKPNLKIPQPQFGKRGTSELIPVEKTYPFRLRVRLAAANINSAKEEKPKFQTRQRRAAKRTSSLQKRQETAHTSRVRPDSAYALSVVALKGQRGDPVNGESMTVIPTTPVPPITPKRPISGVRTVRQAIARAGRPLSRDEMNLILINNTKVLSMDPASIKLRILEVKTLSAHPALIASKTRSLADAVRKLSQKEVSGFLEASEMETSQFQATASFSEIKGGDDGTEFVPREGSFMNHSPYLDGRSQQFDPETPRKQMTLPTGTSDVMRSTSIDMLPPLSIDMQGRSPSHLKTIEDKEEFSKYDSGNAFSLSHKEFMQRKENRERGVQMMRSPKNKRYSEQPVMDHINAAIVLKTRSALQTSNLVPERDVSKIIPKELRQFGYTQAIALPPVNSQAKARRAAVQAIPAPAVDPFGNDLGLDSFDGLQPPENEVPIFESEVWSISWALRQREKTDRPDEQPALPKGVMRPTPHLNDPSFFVLEKFPPEPKGTEEIQHCTVPLTPRDISLIKIGCTMYDFEIISVNSHNKFSFNMANQLSHPIHVDIFTSVLALTEPARALKIREQHFPNEKKKERRISRASSLNEKLLSGKDIEDAIDISSTHPLVSNPWAQVVPSGAMAGFDVVFQPQSTGTIEEKLFCTFNRSPLGSFPIVVRAKVVPTQIVCRDASESNPLELNLNSTNMFNESVEKTIELRNPGNAPVDFALKINEDSIVANPVAGTIPSNGLSCIKISWIPGTQAQTNAEMEVLVQGGDDLVIPIVATLTPGRLVFTDNPKSKSITVNTGSVCVGDKKEAEISLSNPLGTECFFVCSTDSPNILLFESQGRIPRKSAHKVKIQINGQEKAKIATTVQINVRGGNRLDVNIVGRVEFPQLDTKSVGDPIIGSSGALGRVISSMVCKASREQVTRLAASSGTHTGQLLGEVPTNFPDESRDFPFIHFGEVPVRSRRTCTFSVANIGFSKVKFFIDLTMYEDLFFSLDGDDTTDSEDGTAAVPGERYHPQTSIGSRPSTTGRMNPQSQQPDAETRKATILACTRLQMESHFQPKSGHSHSFSSTHNPYAMSGASAGQSLTGASVSGTADEFVSITKKAIEKIRKNGVIISSIISGNLSSLAAVEQCVNKTHIEQLVKTSAGRDIVNYGLSVIEETRAQEEISKETAENFMNSIQNAIHELEIEEFNRPQSPPAALRTEDTSQPTLLVQRATQRIEKESTTDFEGKELSGDTRIVEVSLPPSTSINIRVYFSPSSPSSPNSRSSGTLFHSENGFAVFPINFRISGLFVQPREPLGLWASAKPVKPSLIAVPHSLPFGPRVCPDSRRIDITNKLNCPLVLQNVTKKDMNWCCIIAVALPYGKTRSSSDGENETQDTLTSFSKTTSSRGKGSIIHYLFPSDFKNANLVQPTTTMPFTVYPMSGTIKSKGTIKLRVSFAPPSIGPHSCSLIVLHSTAAELITRTHLNTLHLDDHSVASESPFSFLASQGVSLLGKEEPSIVDLTGFGLDKQITFSQSSVILPTVPLGVPSSALVWIYNTGYVSSEFSISPPPELSQIPLVFIWPWGRKLSSVLKRIPLIISFISFQPISFSATIKLLDSEDMPYGFQIMGTASNSRFTTDSFYSANAGRVDICYETKNIPRAVFSSHLGIGKTRQKGSDQSERFDAGFIPTIEFLSRAPRQILSRVASDLELSESHLKDLILATEANGSKSEIVISAAAHAIGISSKTLPEASRTLFTSLFSIERVDESAAQHLQGGAGHAGSRFRGTSARSLSIVPLNVEFVSKMNQTLLLGPWANVDYPGYFWTSEPARVMQRVMKRLLTRQFLDGAVLCSLPKIQVVPEVPRGAVLSPIFQKCVSFLYPPFSMSPFPQIFSSENGTVTAFKFIQSLSGKRIEGGRAQNEGGRTMARGRASRIPSGKPQTTIPSDAGNDVLRDARQCIEMYKKMLSFLANNGALVNNIPPELLLDREHYIAFTLWSFARGLVVHYPAGTTPHDSPPAEIVNIGTVGSIRRLFSTIWMFNYPLVWSAVVRETIRVFLLDKVTSSSVDKTISLLSEPKKDQSSGAAKPTDKPSQRTRSFTSRTEDKDESNGASDIPAPLPEAMVDFKFHATGSFVLSGSEVQLLRWSEWHLSRIRKMVSPSEEPPEKDDEKVAKKGNDTSSWPLLKGFDNDFASFEALCAILVSHAPELRRLLFVICYQDELLGLPDSLKSQFLSPLVASILGSDTAFKGKGKPDALAEAVLKSKLTKPDEPLVLKKDGVGYTSAHVPDFVPKDEISPPNTGLLPKHSGKSDPNYPGKRLFSFDEPVNVEDIITLAKSHFLAREFCNGLKELDINIGLNEQELLSATPQDFIFITLMLFKILPSYVPTFNISMTSELGGSVEQTIELKNPSSRPISFEAHLITQFPTTIDAFEKILEQRFKTDTTYTSALKRQEKLSEVMKHKGKKGASHVHSRVPSIGNILDGNEWDHTTKATMSDEVASRRRELMMDIVSENAFPTRENEFSLEKKNFTISPKKTERIKVMFSPRFIMTMPVLLRFTPQRQSLTSQLPAPVIFKISPSVTAGKPQGVNTISCNCYENKTATIEITNPFDANSEIDISLTQARLGPPNSVKFDKNGHTRPPPKLHLAPHMEAIEKATVQIQAFSIPQSVKNSFPMQIHKKEAMKVRIRFLPYHPGDYLARVIFTDTERGGFAYELHATALPPAPAQNIPVNGLVKTEVKGVVAVPYNSPFLERAVSLRLNRENPSIDIAREPFAKSAPVQYALFTDAPFLVIPPTYTLKPPQKRKGQRSRRAKTASDQDTVDGADNNSLEFFVNGDTPGTYNGHILMRSAFDTRVIAVRALLHDHPEQISLDMCCHAREVVAQEVPIYGPAGSVLSVMFKVVEVISDGSSSTAGLVAIDRMEQNPDRSDMSEGGEGEKPNQSSHSVRLPLATPTVAQEEMITFVQIPRSIDVGGEGRTIMNLQLAPEWACKFRGELHFTHALSNTSFKYDLTVEVLDPEPFTKISLTSKAHESVKSAVIVPNPMGDTETLLTVFSNVPVVTCPKELPIPAGKTSATLPLSLFSTRAGFAGGTVTLVPPNGRFIWFHVNATVDPSDPISEFELQCPVRETVTAYIPLNNPHADTVLLNVDMSGQGVFGQNTVVLGPNEEVMYEVNFSPLNQGESEGLVFFTSAVAGDFWYKLNLIGLPPIADELTPFSTPVGIKQETNFTIFNPLEEPTEFSIEFEEAPAEGFHQFYTVPQRQIVVPPMSEADLVVGFNPLFVDRTVSNTLKIVSNGGEYVVRLTGKGTLPKPMSTHLITAPPSVGSSSVMIFTNPFSVRLQASVKLNFSDKPSPLLSLMVKKPRDLSIPPHGTLQIPLQFSPTHLTSLHGDVTVSVKPETKAARQVKMRSHGAVSTSLTVKKTGSLTESQRANETSTEKPAEPRTRFVFPFRALASIIYTGPSLRLSVSARQSRIKVFSFALHGLRAALETDLQMISETDASTTTRRAPPASIKSLAMASSQKSQRSTRVGTRKAALLEKFLSSSLKISVDFSSERSGGERSDRSRERQALEKSFKIMRTAAQLPLHADVEGLLRSASDWEISEIVQRVSTQATEDQESMLSTFESLSLPVSFAPLRPGTFQARVIVERTPGGGSWIFPIQLIAGEVVPDTTITVESHGPGMAGEHALALHNAVNQYEKFRAYFTTNSPAGLSVEPVAGTLEPAGRNPTILTVRYKPVSYGVRQEGTLLVESRSCQWAWNVRCGFTAYKPPEGSARVQSFRPGRHRSQQ
eukprot:gnl/Chilomastix_cuspidata/4610.p1 GENE.gnl/Chilomastix_cuspidata/4610~~gnl/Chilomastix_cuspidata/4610.p1  ORF type:complete len:4471 (+),score=485.10 gnl/Chilomastix_cuspidata/4610:114-13526(+)